MPLAYFITFSTYGTWLPGNEKGSVDRKHNAYGTRLLAADEQRARAAKESMPQPPYTLSAPERDVACRAAVELAQGKGWDLLALHVRSNHVHVVVAADRDPGRLMSDLKARASRELNRAGFDNAQRNRWTRHGSTLYLFREDQVHAKVNYTLNEQGERMVWYAKEGVNQEPRTK